MHLSLLPFKTNHLIKLERQNIQFMKPWIYLCVIILFASCASHRLKYSSDVKDWEQIKNNSMPDGSPQYVLYSIGDAGYLPDGNISPALTGLETMLANETAPAGVIFLGDNIYPEGMPKKDDPDRTEAESRIGAQIDAVKDFDGDLFFIPGNHDWRQEDGPKGIRRQEKFIEKELKGKPYYPDDGCSGPVDFRLSPDVAMIIIDSEWYLRDWDKYVDFNEKCLYKTRFDFMYELTDLIKKYSKDKRLIIALHHPVFTEGVHGGKFSVKDHLLPLTNLKKPVPIPLPVIGSLYPILRKNAGIREDINGDKYKELRTELLKHTDVFDNIIFISGHEHNMQYIYREDHHHIVTGSGSKITPVGMGEGSEFAVSERGFGKLSFYGKGEAWIEYFSCASGSPKLIYARKLADDLTTFDAENLTFEPPRKPFVESTITEKNMNKGGLYRFFMGEQYSSLYNKPIRARVTNLSIKEGGLKGVKRGGGFQTNSVRLEDSKERDWVMRAMKKDPTRLLPDEFVGTAAIEAVDYFLTTAHPLAAYTIAPMASSIDILHTKPELVYIPRQQALGEYNEDHGDQLYLFEDRPAGDRSDRDNFGNSEKIISTDDLVEKMKEKGTHRPDQHNVIRNRLFDMVLGDWDRHDDQWRWARFDGPDKQRIYKPVPRDRDQAYSIFEGLLVGFARIFSPGIAKFQTFDEEIKRVDYFNFNARYFDRSFLNELTWEDWKIQVSHIQENLTDEIIYEGINQMQSDFYALHGAEIETKLKSRRDNLKEYAQKYYLSLSKAVSVHGTYNDDLIEITKKPKHIEVKLSETNKEGKIKYTYYQRIFKDSETKEIRIYGLDGDDKFLVKGSGSSIKVRMIGGTDDDAFNNADRSSNNHVYDVPNSSTVSGSGIREHLSTDYDKNAYDRKDFKYNHSFALPLFGFNPDDGFLLGGMFTGTWHGFKKDPYASSHTITGMYSFLTEGFRFDYTGRFVDAIGNWNIKLDGIVQGELFADNFFGVGNETVNPSEDEFGFDFDFNRVRNSKINANIFLEKDLGDQAVFYFGPKLDIQEVDYTLDDGQPRYIATLYDPSDLVFERISYTGGAVGFAYKNVDNVANPHQGVNIDVAVDYLTDLDDFDLSRTTLSTELGVLFPLDNKENLIWAHRIGAGFTFGDDVLFYHLQQLGGQNGLRGYRNERFTGQSMLYYNTDLRVRLFDFDSFFAPSTVGLYGGYDIGRVWVEDQDSDEWHSSFGGGAWISPFDMVVIKAGFFANSDEEQPRVLIGLGFDF